MNIKYVLLTTGLGLLLSYLISFLISFEEYERYTVNVFYIPRGEYTYWVVTLFIPTFFVILIVALFGIYKGATSSSEIFLVGVLIGVFLIILGDFIIPIVHGDIPDLSSLLFPPLILQDILNIILPCLIAGGIVYCIFAQKRSVKGLVDEKEKRYDVEKYAKKYCPYCGAELNIRAKICPKCGVEQVLPEEVSDTWYIVPFFFGVIGGLIAWVANKDRNPVKARNFLIFGIFWSIVLVIIAWILIAAFLL